MLLNAQEKKTSYSDQYWFQYYGNLAFTEKFSAVYDGGIRFKNSFTEKVAALGRIGLQYKFGKHLSAAAGGAYFSQYTNNKITREEWRLYEEIQYKHEINRLKLGYRLRIEQRWFHYLKNGSDDYNNRTRFRVQAIIPLTKKKLESNTLFLVLADEFFLNFGSNITYNFNHNRAIGGFGYRFNEAITINLFYTSIYNQKNTAVDFEYSDMIWLNLQHTLKIRTNKDNIPPASK